MFEGDTGFEPQFSPYMDTFSFPGSMRRSQKGTSEATEAK